MRAAFPPVSYSLRSLYSAMFGRHAGLTRLAVAYLLFTVTLMMVPKPDILETPFDEANTPTNEIVVEKTASLSDPRQPVTAFAPKRSSRWQRVSVHRILPVYAKLLTDSRTFRELFCFFLC
jgi:hypothetical protein